MRLDLAVAVIGLGMTVASASLSAQAAPPAEPEVEAPVNETTKFQPEFIYRMAALTPVKNSVYYSKNYTDFADQMFLTLHFTRTYNYIHEVVLEPAFRTIRNNPASWDKDYVADQAYIESSIQPWLSLTAGKKAEFNGSGFFVNPSDLLNENKDEFDPLYQKEGVVFTRLMARHGDYSLGLGFIPARGLGAKAGRAWLTMGGQLFDVDVKIQATEQEAEKTTVGLSAQRFFGGAFELHTDSRYQQRQRNQQVGNETPTAYSAYSGPSPDTSSDDSPSGYYVAGTRYVFDHQKTAVFELIQNQSGLLPEEFSTYFAALRLDQVDHDRVRNPPTQILGRHYWFAAYQDEGLVKSTHFSINALQNTDDKSAFVAVVAKYHLSPITSVELAPTFFKGGENTEFGEMPFSSATYLIFRGLF